MATFLCKPGHSPCHTPTLHPAEHQCLRFNAQVLLVLLLNSSRAPPSLPCLSTRSSACALPHHRSQALGAVASQALVVVPSTHAWQGANRQIQHAKSHLDGCKLLLQIASRICLANSSRQSPTHCSSAPVCCYGVQRQVARSWLAACISANLLFSNCRPTLSFLVQTHPTLHSPSNLVAIRIGKERQ